MNRPDVDEALRYLGAARADPELRGQAEALADELAAALQPRYVWTVCPLTQTGDSFRLEGTAVELSGATAQKMLKGCGQAALLACTLGARFDAMLRTVQARDMARAVLLDALGSAFVEAGCNAAEQEISARLPGLYLTDRFSPGYGDLPLTVQPALCAALDGGRRLGLTVTGSLLLNPMKSVTAILGLSDAPQPARVRGCQFCALAGSCPYRKEGTTCGC